MRGEAERGGYQERRGPQYPTLSGASETWPSPTAHDGRRPGPDPASTQEWNLKREAENWPTPDACVSTRSNRSVSAGAATRPLLSKAATAWPTPTRADSERRSSEYYRRGRHNPTLIGAVRQLWATVAERDYKDSEGMQTVGINPDGSLRRRDDQLGRQALQSAISGLPSSSSIPTSPRRLNPDFCDWLMGLPPGWTASAPLETESFRSWLHTHTELLHALLDSNDTDARA